MSNIDWDQVVTVEQKERAAAQAARQQYKTERAGAVEQSVVTVDGMAFQANEASMTRVAHALASTAQEFEWILLDNTVASITRAQLQRVADAGWAAINELWVDDTATKYKR